MGNGGKSKMGGTAHMKPGAKTYNPIRKGVRVKLANPFGTNVAICGTVTRIRRGSGLPTEPRVVVDWAGLGIGTLPISELVVVNDWDDWADRAKRLWEARR